MNSLTSPEPQAHRVGSAVALRLACQAAIFAIASSLVACSALPKTNATANAPAEPTQTQAHKSLTGAELYAIHCNRCHPERYGPERTEAQWTTILLHMRTRANLPAEQAHAILKYLQEGSGS